MFPRLKYKILVILSLFVLLLIFVYSRLLLSNSYKTKTSGRLLFFNKFNSFLSDIIDTNEIEDSSFTTSNPINLEKFPKIFCMILTHETNIGQKVPVVFQTWAKDCDKFFFVTKMNNSITNVSIELTDPFPILQPANHNAEVYGKLTDKVYKTLRDIYLRYNDYDWYLKADDDTFIFVDNLKSFLKTKNSSQPVTYGYDFKVIVDHGYHSGGAGYVLSNEALKRIGPKLSPEDTFCPNTGIEDVDVAKCLRLLGVYPNKSIDEKERERFHPFDVKTHLFGAYPDWYLQYASNPVQKGIESCSETSISFHYMSSQEIEKLYALWNDAKKLDQQFNLTSIFLQMI